MAPTSGLSSQKVAQGTSTADKKAGKTTSKTFAWVREKYHEWRDRRNEKKMAKRPRFPPTISEPTFIGKTTLDYTQLRDGLVTSHSADGPSSSSFPNGQFMGGLTNDPAYGPHVPAKKRQITTADIRRLSGEGPQEGTSGAEIDEKKD